MDFFTAIRTVLIKKYADFSGRARRAEFWWFALFSLLASMAISVIDTSPISTFGVIGTLWSLAILIPSVAVGVRRLHDNDMSGWWYLVIFIPVIGILLLIFFWVQKGTKGANRFGAEPKN